MSSISEITPSDNLLEKFALDSSSIKDKDISGQLPQEATLQSSIIVALAETVDYVARAVIYGVSVSFIGYDQLVLQSVAMGILKLLLNKQYTKEDIEKFDNRQSYVQAFKEKSIAVANLSPKDKAYWLSKQVLTSTIYKVIAAAIILTLPAQLPVGANVVLFTLHRYTAVITALNITGMQTENLLNYAEAKMHSYVYHLVQKQQTPS
jgi:hypothetical protein